MQSNDVHGSLAFSATQLGAGSLLTAGNYTPINPGQTTTLVIDNSTQPPVQYWTDPVNSHGTSAAKAVNGTGSPTNIGVGFITDLNKPAEDMHVALTWLNVGAGMAVAGNFTPVLSAYLTLDFQENQLITSDIMGVAPVWQMNLLELQQDTTIIISKDQNGHYIASQLAPMEEAEEKEEVTAISASIGPENVTRVYRATLSFGTQSIVSDSLKTISEHLHNKGYRVKVTLLGKATDALIELVLPANTSCNKAEKEVLACIEDHGFPVHIAIKERSGELLAYSKDRFSFWEDINPATNGWYVRKNIVPYATGPGPVKTQHNGDVLADAMKA
ncbi:hypothetical protein L227DRAFT_572628 [Lentinus tigrinus ALCF2SS1-6]|uniref:Uncharacterized protein n=1 Tax=Lentinus tigrinus ALCF2SS1-6 TaxID=1328759 RepID=A0A5C2SI70_9APHY|nr:hypothetical protein L227DRAFT_572628 [Lentinus tigrinus ALCF2SS1-6]